MVDISITAGKRGFICGTAGSGKTTLALSLVEAWPSPIVVVDTKYDPGIEAWAKRNKIRIHMKKDMPDFRQIKTDIIVRPPAAWLAKPIDIDWWLGQAFYCPYIPSVYIDEGYQVGATTSRLGEGVSGLWSRSRVFGMRCLIGAQRPAWLNKFVMTESNYLYVGRLNNLDDRKAIVNNTGQLEALERQPAHQFLFIRQDGSDPVRLKPLDVSKGSLYDRADRNETRTKMRKVPK